jgi:hypothetical protein
MGRIFSVWLEIIVEFPNNYRKYYLVFGTINQPAAKIDCLERLIAVLSLPNKLV